MPLPSFRRPLATALVALLAAACGDTPVAPDHTAPDTGPVRGIAVGVVRDAAGSPVAGANVYVGTFRGRAATGGAGCAQLDGLLRSVVRAVTDAQGRFRVAIPDGAPQDSIGCALAYTELPAAGATVGEPAALSSNEFRATALPTTTADSVRLDLTASPVTGHDTREPDDTWARVAQTTVPGFAGFLFEGCTVVLQLTDPTTQAAAARSYVTGVLGGRGAGGTCTNTPPFDARRVTYDFAQLRRWYDRVQILTSLEGWSSTDIDEGRNRIALGYVDSTAIARARRGLASLDVPAEAVLFEIVPRGSFDRAERR